MDELKTNKNKQIFEFHDKLQSTVSHYTPDKRDSERLLFDYKKYLDIIINMYQECNKEYLIGFKDFPWYLEDNELSYLNQVSKLIKEHRENFKPKKDKHIYRIRKIKQYKIDGEILYEVFFINSSKNKPLKYNTFVAYTDLKIDYYYSLNFCFIDRFITVEQIKGKIPIKIIKEYKIAIKKSEINLFLSVFENNLSLSTEEVKLINKFLNNNIEHKTTFLSIVNKVNDEFNSFQHFLTNNKVNNKFLEVLSRCEKIIKTNKPGNNILKYFLFTMNEYVMKQQKDNNHNPYFNLYLGNKVKSFDELPFRFKPKGTSLEPQILKEIINQQEHKHTILAEKIHNELKNQIGFCIYIEDNPNIKEKISEIKDLINKYNKTNTIRYWKNQGKDYSLILEENQDGKYRVYEQFNFDCYKNIKQLIEKYSKIEKEDKNRNEILDKVFEKKVKSKLVMLTGPAGSGKTHYIKKVYDLFKDKNKNFLFLTTTHSMLNSLKKRLGLNDKDKDNFQVVKQFLSNWQNPSFSNLDFVIIDECSTINNEEILKILKKLEDKNIKFWLMVGDPNQLESIGFGNWFKLLSKHREYNFELKNSRRTQNEKLERLWKNLIDLKDKSKQTAEKDFDNFLKPFIKELNEEIFTKTENENDEDENNKIILCLNYNGIYGINHINQIMQSNNSNKPYNIGMFTFKVGDPILFTDIGKDQNGRNYYNNLKGKIEEIRILEEENGNSIIFKIKCPSILSEFIEIKSVLENSDSDNQEVNLPFTLSYAISINKAQGLEFNSVSLVFSSITDDLITFEIFYTAVTRAKKHLKIYWSPEVERKIKDSILDNLNISRNNLKDTKKFLKEKMLN
ncbi:ATP-dependent RecD-like DNA helicase [Mesomycoplasma hyorhinis]|uniref:ATP-dependent RecD-like DNA helicase n=1 Tax=Mesomycoplasma hyorhinis TaxID=2100 RepID=UPI00307D6872